MCFILGFYGILMKLYIFEVPVFIHKTEAQSQNVQVDIIRRADGPVAC